MTAIAIIGDYSAEAETHLATTSAINHSLDKLRLESAVHWVNTKDICDSLFERHRGILVAPGSPYQDMSKVLSAIRFARENNIPCLGTCGGFQHMVIEYARNVLGVKHAEHAEYDPYSSNLFISKLDCSLAGRALELQLVSGSRVAKIYQSTSVTENYYCNFGVAPKHESRLSSDSGISVTGSDTEGKIRVIELNDHPFFIGTLFVPQMRSTSDNPHPLVTEFVRQAGTC